MVDDNEVAVLAACLISEDALATASIHLVERDFYREQHRMIWRALQTLSNTAQPVDVLSVTNLLRSKQALTRAGGASYIATLIDSLPDVSNVLYYAKEVKGESTSRDLVRIGRGMMEETVSPASRMEAAFGLLSDLSNSSVATRETLIGDVAEGIVARVLKGVDDQDGIKTGFDGLDEPLGGLGDGDYVILAARPSIGKSAFALQVATNAAKRNHPVLFIAPEMTEVQLTRRMLSVESGVAYKKISKPSRMTESERVSVREAYEATRTLPLVIDDSADQTINDIRLKARRMKAKSGLDLIVIDYLQLLCEGDDSKEATTVVSRGLKAIAKTIDIPVLAVSQLSRAMAYQNRKRPELTDLRSSGQLEQDADSVLFLWHPTGAKDRIEVFIEKNRNGPLGAEEFYFERDTTKFKKGAW